MLVEGLAMHGPSRKLIVATETKGDDGPNGDRGQGSIEKKKILGAKHAPAQLTTEVDQPSEE